MAIGTLDVVWSTFKSCHAGMSVVQQCTPERCRGSCQKRVSFRHYGLTSPTATMLPPMLLTLELLPLFLRARISEASVWECWCFHAHSRDGSGTLVVCFARSFFRPS